MKIRLMFGLLWLRRFWAITTSNNTAKPCHCFLSLFSAKHRAARDQWPVQLIYSSFVSPSHWKKTQSIDFLHFTTHLCSFTVFIAPLPPSTCSYVTCFNIPVSYPTVKTFHTTLMVLLLRCFCHRFSSHFFPWEMPKTVLARENCPLAKLATMPCFPGDWDYTFLPVRRSVFKITSNPSIPSKEQLTSPLGLKKCPVWGQGYLRSRLYAGFVTPKGLFSYVTTSNLLPQLNSEG